MDPTKLEEEKRVRLIGELWREREAIMARAVQNAPECRFENDVLVLDYQDSDDKAWAKVFATSDKMPRLKAIAKQIGIIVKVVS
jgi:hypothetical protein